MRAAPTRASLKPHLPAALSIAGSDSGAGAGVQADLLTFAARGVFGTTAITCLTAQNPTGVAGVHAAPADFVRQQVQAVYAFFPVRAAKTGMLFDASIVDVVASFFEAHREIRLVVDPVMIATSGAVLLREDAIAALIERLFPLAEVITPNLDEGAVLLGRRPQQRAELVEAAVCLASRYQTSVLLKGGHLEGDRLLDVLADPHGRVRRYEGNRIDGVDTHGSGCTLSAAIAAELALGRPLGESVALARRYLRRGMTHALTTGGRRFIAH